MVLVVAVLLAASRGINEQRIGEDNLRFLVHGRAAGPSEAMGVDAAGVLPVADGCVLLELESSRYPVVWPSGTSVAGEDPLAIDLPSGERVELGESVRGGGGYLGAGDIGIEVPDECLNEYREVAVFNRDDDPVGT